MDVTAGGLVHGEFGELAVTLTNGVYSYLYTLRDNTSGNGTHEDFSVTLTDDDGDTATATLTINIVDDEPDANADVDAVNEDGPTVATGNILTAVDALAGDENTTDGVADVTGADDATITAFSGAGGAGTLGVALDGAHGSLLLNASGGYTYTLDNGSAAVQALGAGETLTDTFSYTITDGDDDNSTTTLTITITGTNDAPVAVSDTNWTAEEAGPISGNVLVDTRAQSARPTKRSRGDVADSDVDGDDLSVTLDENPVGSYGTLTAFNTATGAYTYQVDNTQSGGPGAGRRRDGDRDLQLYRRRRPRRHRHRDPDHHHLRHQRRAGGGRRHQLDGRRGGPISGNVLVTAAHNGAPDDLPRGDVADSDVDGDDLDVTLDGAPVGSFGTLTAFNTATGAYTYQVDNANPAVQALGVGETVTETYNYTVDDGHGGTDTATLTITIFGTNDAPVAVDDTNWTTEEAGPISGNVLVDTPAQRRAGRSGPRRRRRQRCRWRRSRCVAR